MVNLKGTELSLILMEQNMKVHLLKIKGQGLVNKYILMEVYIQDITMEIKEIKKVFLNSPMGIHMKEDF